MGERSGRSASWPVKPLAATSRTLERLQLGNSSQLAKFTLLVSRDILNFGSILRRRAGWDAGTIESHEMLTDTQLEAVQRELLRRMSASQKLSLVDSLTTTVVSLCKQGIRHSQLEYRELDVDVHFSEMNYGKDLAVGFRKRLEQDDS